MLTDDVLHVEVLMFLPVLLIEIEIEVEVVEYTGIVVEIEEAGRIAIVDQIGFVVGFVKGLVEYLVKINRL